MHTKAESEGCNDQQLGTFQDGRETSDGSTRPSEALDAKAKLRDKNKKAQQRLRERKKARQ